MLFLVIYMFLICQFESEATILCYCKVSAPLQCRTASGKTVRTNCQVIEISTGRSDVTIRSTRGKVACNGRRSFAGYLYGYRTAAKIGSGPEDYISYPASTS